MVLTVADGQKTVVIDSALGDALRELRRVRAQRPDTAESSDFAAWRDRMAKALDDLARVLVFEDDRSRARAEAKAARVEAAAIRSRLT